MRIQKLADFLPNLRTTLIVVVLLIVLSSALIFAKFGFPLRINLSTSMPIGIYQITHQPIRVGDIVTVCLPDSIAQVGLSRGYLGRGRCQTGAEPEPVVKEIVAMAGSVVELSQQSVRINDQSLPHSQTYSDDQKGRAMPEIPRGTYRLSSQQVWLYGTNSPYSWDSRYYGPVNLSDIQHVLKPLITWKESVT